ncbi:MAG: hypothetical protein GKS06_03115 [Acidobacteria bacterium]|nr:hypothetical protein [Acidobacteriota bacterium]
MKPSRFLLIDDLRLDLAARRVFRDAEEIELGRLTFDLFAALAQAAPSALSTDEIMSQVWDSEVVSDETLKQRVSLLRRALGQDRNRVYLRTVRGFGYSLATEPVHADEWDSAHRGEPASGGRDRALVEPQGDMPDNTPGGRFLRAALLVLAVVAMVLVVTVLAMLTRQLKRWNPESIATRALLGTEAEAARPFDATRAPASTSHRHAGQSCSDVEGRASAGPGRACRLVVGSNTEQVSAATDQEHPGSYGGAGHDRLADRILGQEFELAARAHDENVAILGRQVDAAVRCYGRGGESAAT